MKKRRSYGLLLQTLMILFFSCLTGCFVNTQQDMTRISVPNHRELLAGSPLKARLTGNKLSDRTGFLAFFPLQLIVVGNLVDQPGKLTLKEIPSKANKDRRVKKMISSKDSSQREVGIELLQGNDKEHLLKTLDNKDPYVKILAIRRLSKNKPNLIFPHIDKLLKEPDEYVRLEVVYTLAKLEDKKALKYLHKMLQDSSALVRGKVISLLAKIDNQKSILHLWPILLDQESYIREITTKTLVKLTKIDINYPYYSSLPTRKTSLRRWKHLWKQKEQK